MNENIFFASDSFDVDTNDANNKLILSYVPLVKNKIYGNIFSDGKLVCGFNVGEDLKFKSTRVSFGKFEEHFNIDECSLNFVTGELILKNINLEKYKLTIHYFFNKVL